MKKVYKVEGLSSYWSDIWMQISMLLMYNIYMSYAARLDRDAEYAGIVLIHVVI